MNTTSSENTMMTVPSRKTPPGPRGHFLFGSMRDLLKDNLRFIQDMARQYGDVVKYRIASWTWYQVNHPDGIQRILQDNNRNYGKGALTTGILKPVLGNGLLISEGEFWLRQRRLMQPVFHRRHIATFGDLMTSKTLAMLHRWQPFVAAQKSLDVAEEMTRLTLDVVTEALFSTHVNDETNAIRQAITTFLAEINYRFQMPLYPPLSVPTPRNRRYRAALRTLDQAVYSIINERRRQHVDGDDLLALLMQVRDEETGEGMSDKQLRDEVLTLFIAGHETTANALTWTWYLLSKHPTVERRLHTELAEVLGGRTPTVADIPNLAYTRMVIEEAMRLYPPVWITNRQAVADDEICGYHIPANAIVMISPYVMHRHPGYWENPEEFEPERFAPGAPAERSQGRPHYAYFPFGGGPRQCIGKGFAMLEAQLILATLMQHCRLQLVPGHPVEAEALVTVRPRHGLLMTVQNV